MVNGQTGAVAGQRPVDWTKVWLVIAAILSPGVLLSLLGLITSILGVGVAVGGFGFFLLLVGVVIAIIILRKAMSMDDV